MNIICRRLASALLVLTPLLGLCLSPSPASAQKRRNPSGLDVRAWPAEIRKGHADFQKKCADCHDLQLALEKRYAPRTWRKYIVKMMKKDDGGLDGPTGRSIYGFLTFYGRNRPGQAPAPPVEKAPDPEPEKPVEPEAAAADKADKAAEEAGPPTGTIGPPAEVTEKPAEKTE